LILPKPILEAPRLGCFNLHASALPRWRGAAPINRAIMAGDAATAVMVMRMEEGLDTGPVAMAEWVPIEPDMTAGELHDRLALLGADLVGGALEKLEMHVLQLKPQPRDGITYATKIDKAETRIDWTKSWRQVHDHCRGLSPFPGAWCEIGGTRIKVLRTTKGEGSGVPGKVLDDNLTVACGDGAIRILRLQVAGKRAMTADEYLHGMRGMHVAPGTVLG
jgi:methionyl-tRNA formyltransferase